MESGERDGDGFVVGPFTEQDLEGISALITRMDRADGRQRLRDKSTAYYRWMYLENPVGPAVVHCARLGQEVVASFAMAPKIFRIEGQQRLLGKTMDMFTDPQHQGKGLIGRCSRAVFDDAATAGITQWYVTPSVNSYPIFTNRWGYRECLELVYRFRVLSYAPVLTAVAGRFTGPAGRIGAVLDAVRSRWGDGGSPLPQGWSLEVMSSLGEDVDQLWEGVADGYRVAQVRDSAYLNWRYVRNPDEYTILGLRRDAHLVGLMVLGTTTRRGIAVGEVVDHVCAVDDDVTLGLLLDAALAHSRTQGHALLQAWSIRGTRSDARLRRAGLPLRRAGVKFLISPGTSDPALHDPEAWLLTQGDGNDV